MYIYPCTYCVEMKRYIFVKGTKGMLSPHKIENPIQMLDYYIYEIYWYRMGMQRYKDDYPHQPCDIVGILRNGQWFYYKDGHPHLFNRKQTHRQWVCLTAISLKQLLLKMDYRDVDHFIYNYTKWSPMDLKRCGCVQCQSYYTDDGKPRKLSLLFTSSATQNNRKYKDGNELEISLIGGNKTNKTSAKCCDACIIL